MSGEHLINYKTITEHIGKECIYVNNMSRAGEICFKNKVQYFSGNLTIMIPKQQINLDSNRINSEQFKKLYVFRKI